MIRWRRRSGILALISLLSLLSDTDVHTKDVDPLASLVGCRRPSDLDAFHGSVQLRGDVDGDGASDRVFLAVNRTGAPHCRYWVVVATKKRKLIAALKPQPWFHRVDAETVLSVVSLQSLIQLKPRGLDVTVRTSRGASWHKLEIFTVTSSRRRASLVPRIPASGTFSYGGTVSQFGVIDCAGRGSRLILMSKAVKQESGWRVSRLVYRATEFQPSQLIRRLSVNVLVPRYDEIAARFPEFADGAKAFRSCTA